MGSQLRHKFRRQVDEIVSGIIEFIDEYGNVSQYEEHLFRICKDAYERGFCGPLRYRRYDDTLRSEWILTKPSVSGDRIWNCAVEKGYIHSEPVDGDDTDSFRRLKLHTVRTLWDAWTFALHELGHRHSCYRRYPKDPIRRPPGTSNERISAAEIPEAIGARYPNPV